MRSDYRQGDALQAIRETIEDRQRLREEAEKLDERIAVLVNTAREYEASWRDISAVLGTSRQAAWERYGHLDKTHGRTA